MPTQKIESLMTELNEYFGNATPSPEQQRMLEELAEHMHAVDEQGPVDPTPLETIELLLEQIGEDHPKTSAVLSELLQTLKNIGV